MDVSRHNLLAVWTFWESSNGSGGTYPYTAGVDDSGTGGGDNTWYSAVGPTLQLAASTPTTAQLFYAKDIFPSSGGINGDPIRVTYKCLYSLGPPVTGNPACTMSPSISLAGVVVVEYSGLDQNNPLDSVSAGYSTSGNQTNLLDSGNAAPANSNLLVFAGGISDNGTTAAGTGFLSVQSHSLTGGGSAITEQSSNAITGNNVLQRATACLATGMTCSPATTGNWLMQMAVFRDASWTVSGAWSPVRPAQVRYAEQFQGSDCGAKINAADADLAANVGEIWVSNACGMAWTTPVTLSSSHVLRFVQGGTYTVGKAATCGSTTAGICLANNTLLAGATAAMAPNDNAPAGSIPNTMIMMANGANLASIVTINGYFAGIQDINIDGNQANNSAGSNIVVNSGVNRFEISRVTSGHAHTNGLTYSSAGKIFKLLAYENLNDGLSCNAAGDTFITDSEFENNGGNGIELSSCPSTRIIHSDFGMNSLNLPNTCGLNIHGTSTLPSYGILVSTNQFGNNELNELCITGTSSGGGSSANANNIVGNSFVGSQFYQAANTYSELKLVDGGLNTIHGNEFFASGGLSNTGPCHPIVCSNYSGISISETTAPYNEGNKITGNVFIDSTSNGGSPTFGTGRIVDSTATNGVTCSAIAANEVALSGWGTTSVGTVSGTIPSCLFTITTGTSFSSSPTVKFTYPGSLGAGLGQVPACQLTPVAVTGLGGAILFSPTATSLTSTTWTAHTSTGGVFTPAASESYTVVLSCSP
jgi:hypothetical protein